MRLTSAILPPFLNVHDWIPRGRMIGTKLVEAFVQAVALTHRVKGYSHVSALIIASPESGKTTITAGAAKSPHVAPIAVMSGRSILKEIRENKEVDFLLFNDLTCIRAMSQPAVNLLINLLNQITQDEHGKVGFAGKDDVAMIDRRVGVIGCIPFTTFTDHRAKWMELGFVSRMIPFAYAYDAEIVANIKDAIDNGTHAKKRQPRAPMPAVKDAPVDVKMPSAITRSVRALADERSRLLGQLGIRLLSNYHGIIRAHALLNKRRAVTQTDLQFLRDVDAHVAVDKCVKLKL